MVSVLELFFLNAKHTCSLNGFSKGTKPSLMFKELKIWRATMQPDLFSFDSSRSLYMD